jgi:hypothetical protein
MAAFPRRGGNVVCKEPGGRARGCGCGGGCFCGDRPFAEGFGFEAVLFLRAVSSVDEIGDGRLAIRRVTSGVGGDTACALGAALGGGVAGLSMMRG